MLLGCATPERLEYTRLVMGVQCRIVLYAPDRAAGDDAARAAFAELARLERIFSDYRDTSEVSALARHAGTQPMRVSPELIEILQDADRVHRATGGVFDVTVGPVSRLWREARRVGTPPDPFELADALALVGASSLHLDPEAGTVLLEHPGMSLDLGGIAKGYSVQQALGVLRERGVRRALVALAGDLALGDPPPGRRGWRIALPCPAEPLGAGALQPLLHTAGAGAFQPPLHVATNARPVTTSLLQANTCISTSGPEEQSIEVDGRRLSHIIDPRTGMGGESPVTVTVIAPRGAIADALASALTLLDTAAGRAVLAAFSEATVYVGVSDLASRGADAGGRETGHATPGAGNVPP